MALGGKVKTNKIIAVKIIAMMRRKYRASRSPRKDFINSYHINEVPLPYYNPLEDPYLSGFFANFHVSRHLNRSGLLYNPRKEYPY